MSFDSLGLSAEIVRAVTKQGYNKPTPIQLQTIPPILQRLDIMGSAQTGTGKTASFTLPLLHLLQQQSSGKKDRPVRALILTPTRELAAQVAESVETYGKYLSLKSTAVFGGVNIASQIKKLRRGIDILIATPGRLLDHVNQKTVDLSHVNILVLDEADRMLDMGFIHDVRKVIKLLPKKCQNLLFSATLSNDIKKLADTLLTTPVMISVTNNEMAPALVKQRIHPVDRARKQELLSHLITSQNWQQVLVFTRTKHEANRLAQQLEKNKISALAIHGNKTQRARTLALSQFKDNKVRVLVATDIAARGLDINQLPHVVNFELPNVPEDYVHRIGRTGRAGNEGEAISLVCVDEHKFLRDIERLIKRELPKEVIADYEPNLSIKPKPIQNRRYSSRNKSSFSGDTKKKRSTGPKDGNFSASRKKPSFPPTNPFRKKSDRKKTTLNQRKKTR